MEDLQKIINDKAEKRATEEVNKLIKAIAQNNNLQTLLGKVTIKFGENRTDNMRSAFWSITSNLPKQLIEQLTEIYIPEESKAFVDKVNNLSEEIEELKNYNYDNRD